MSQIEPKIEAGWKFALQDAFTADSFGELKSFLVKEKKAGVAIFPPGPQIFAAFEHTPFDRIKVVILGQDPYHGPGQAHGLSFSVTPGTAFPPSLLNIFKEIRSDLGYPIPSTGSLIPWADQGVLLLNATLTVRSGQAGSHQGKGWEAFTDSVIRTISEKKTGIIFILWGKFAQAKEVLIDTTKHYILKSPHPSPFSADRGFFGSKPFSRTNEILVRDGKTPINWQLP
ncbi:MAG: uracil-DNA glycosylase [Bacteroidia bacterium]|nr:uracil-DNA glycosylase [Bacteroidia bacterium]MBP7269789.1 uracil-DNA glycosylase [Bacteroidia bacterium]MBP7772196.1 uracil-DNA glycosylase [Bacteroidia bacterium]